MSHGRKGRSHQQRSRKTSARSPGGARSSGPLVSDAGIYGGLLLIGVFTIFLFWVLGDGTSLWREIGVGYLVAMAFLINAAVLKAWRGVPLARWQEALARLPLRCVGYHSGSGGHPIPAARGRSEVITMFWVSVAVSVTVIATLAMVLIP